MSARKYHNRKVTEDGVTFDSTAEYHHWLYLRSEQEAGRIKGLMPHPTYTLIPRFKTLSGQWERAVTYTPDFQYIIFDPDDPYSEQTVCEDVKGVRTTAYIIKRKLFQFTYPHIIFREVEA